LETPKAYEQLSHGDKTKAYETSPFSSSVLCRNVKTHGSYKQGIICPTERIL